MSGEGVKVERQGRGKCWGQDQGQGQGSRAGEGVKVGVKGGGGGQGQGAKGGVMVGGSKGWSQGAVVFSVWGWV